MFNQCIWVLAGSTQWSAEVAIDRIPSADWIVAANGGSALAAQLGIIPNLVIGDLDSADPNLIAEWERQGIETRRYGHTTKNETDTELAIFAALDWLGDRPGTLYLLGGTGGRLDHTLSNVLLLTHPKLAAVDLRLIESKQEVWLAKANCWNAIEGQVGDVVSLLPVGEDAIGILLEGFIYPLERETLLAGRGRGVSNEIAHEGARLWLDGGKMLVVVSRLRANTRS